MPNLWRKKTTKQRYNYLDRSILEMSGFFKTRLENLETPALPPAVRSLIRKKEKKNSKKKKAVSCENHSDDKKSPNKKKFC